MMRKEHSMKFSTLRSPFLIGRETGILVTRGHSFHQSKGNGKGAKTSSSPFTRQRWHTLVHDLPRLLSTRSSGFFKRISPEVHPYFGSRLDCLFVAHIIQVRRLNGGVRPSGFRFFVLLFCLFSFVYSGAQKSVFDLNCCTISRHIFLKKNHFFEPSRGIPLL